jgi:hypothetical protein
MSWVPDRAGGAAPDRRVPAGQRPTWMVVLASLMVVVAFNLFLGGLSALADGPAKLAGAPVEGGDATSAEAAATRALQRGMAIALQRVDPLLVRGYALAKLVLGALMLFAVAAIATNDRRGRRGTLVAAWAGIAYHVAGALFFILFVRGRLLDAASEWVREVQHLQDAAFPGGSPEQVVSWANQAFVIFPVGLALLGVGFSVVLIAFFGGNRGRAFYGLPPRGVPQAGGGV